MWHWNNAGEQGHQVVTDDMLSLADSVTWNHPALAHF
ncbi:hypothetical protein GZL_07053 [Streptomyces sp. 769]|nr:hypothetical protein GZL_07053 [Streptomyces sp. 769]